MEIICKDHFISKYKVENFVQIKKILMEKINLIPTNPLNELGQKISHTDWNLPTGFQREYLNIFQDEVLSKFIETQNKFWNAQLIIANIWFQVYRKGDFFKAHTHPNGNFTNVFFLHLPNKNLSTKLKAQDDVEINIDLDEGDILTIPAYLKHESPLISQDNEKYILSFNSSITT